MANDVKNRKKNFHFICTGLQRKSDTTDNCVYFLHHRNDRYANWLDYITMMYVEVLNYA